MVILRIIDRTSYPIGTAKTQAKEEKVTKAIPCGLVYMYSQFLDDLTRLIYNWTGLIYQLDCNPSRIPSLYRSIYECISRNSSTAQIILLYQVLLPVIK